MLDLSFLESGKDIRDPIWGYITIPDDLIGVVDSEDYQRLRDISQLGHVLLVYPGARHSRFEHSLGVFHLAGQFVRQLLKSEPSPDFTLDDVRVLLAASLLHDIGHYPFSHLLEEMQAFFVDHEERGRQIIQNPDTEVNQALVGVGIDPNRVANVIDYQNEQVDIPREDLRLAHILSGTLDPDKVDYLLRDARYCGVPFGESVNRDRLIGSITYDAESERPAITYKGVSAVEALIFTSYLMYRNVYWHHAVRSANAMFKRGVQDLFNHPDCGLTESDFIRSTEADLVHRLEQETSRRNLSRRESMVDRLKRRKLHKVARIFLPYGEQEALFSLFASLYYAPDARRDLEIKLCEAYAKKTGLALRGDEILIDIPRFSKSPEVDLKVFFGPNVPIGKPAPLSFDDPEISMLKESLIGNFEAQARVVRVFCLDDDRLLSAVREDIADRLAVVTPTENEVLT
jgi:HD superfamily phosphohydrolase